MKISIGSFSLPSQDLPYESKTRADKRRITECADMLTDTALKNPAM